MCVCVCVCVSLGPIWFHLKSIYAWVCYVVSACKVGSDEVRQKVRHRADDEEKPALVGSFGVTRQYSSSKTPSCLLSIGWKVLSWGPKDEMVWCDYEGFEEMWSGHWLVWCSMAVGGVCGRWNLRTELFSGIGQGKRNNELMQRRIGINPSLQSQPSMLHSTEPGCDLVGQTKAGLVYHIRQGHGVMAQAQLPPVLIAMVYLRNRD